MNNDYDFCDDLDVADAEFDYDEALDYYGDAELERCTNCGNGVSDDELVACDGVVHCYNCMGLEG